MGASQLVTVFTLVAYLDGLGARISRGASPAMIARYRAMPARDVRTLLEMAMDDLTDEEVFMALFDGQVDATHPFHGLARAIRNLAIGNKPSTEWQGAFEEFGVPLTELRARLFAMLPANDQAGQRPAQTVPNRD